MHAKELVPILVGTETISQFHVGLGELFLDRGRLVLEERCAKRKEQN